jgi:hypothetical protein
MNLNHCRDASIQWRKESTEQATANRPALSPAVMTYESDYILIVAKNTVISNHAPLEIVKTN